MLRVVLLLSVFLSIGACQSDDDVVTPGEPRKEVFFDLANFFKAEETVIASYGRATKRIVFNGTEETQTLDSINYQLDLEAFAQSNINRPAWWDKYEVDSTLNAQNELTRLRYTTEDPKMAIRTVQIDFMKNEVQKIVIEKETKSLIAETNKLLTYEVNKGYSIASEQDIMLLDNSSSLVEVMYNQ